MMAGMVPLNYLWEMCIRDRTTTMGKRVAMFGEDIVHGLGSWLSLMDRYSVRGLKGAVGTQLAQLSLFGQDAGRVLELEDRVCAHLGIPSKWPVSYTHLVGKLPVQVRQGIGLVQIVQGEGDGRPGVRIVFDQGEGCLLYTSTRVPSASKQW